MANQKKEDEKRWEIISWNAAPGDYSWNGNYDAVFRFAWQQY